MIGEKAVSGHPAYRADIDGLRAVAVLSVVAYHANPGWLPGGFLGVDIFFVISGYLITSIITGEIKAGTFTIAGFYERRARRILPALLLVLLATCIAAYTLMVPEDLKQFSKSVLATLGFVANHHFYLQTSYFAAPADSMPLLHTWSLAVEEQFYIVWPLLLAFLHARFPSRIVGAVVCFFLLSFAINLVVARLLPDAAFFLAPMRAWELLIGCFLATAACNGPRNRMIADSASLAGLALIVVGLTVVPNSVRLAGLAGLVPCTGAALLIWSSASGLSLGGRLLGLGPVVFVGLISYSLYLWHWPLFSLTRYALDRDLMPIEIAAVVGASLLFATLTWRFVEGPFRRRKNSIPLAAVLRCVAATAIPLAAVSLLAIQTKGMAWRWPSEARSFLANAAILGLPRNQCVGRDPTSRVCQLVKGSKGKRRILVMGDSHVASLIPGFAALAEEFGNPLWYNVRYVCPPLQGVDLLGREGRSGESCRETNARVLKFAASEQIDDVVLIARWNAYSIGPPQFGVERGTPTTILFDQQGPGSDAGNQAVIERSLIRTIAPLVAKGRRVFLVLQIPYTGIKTPAYLAKHALPLAPDSVISIPIGDAHAQRSVWMRALMRRLSEEFGVVQIDPSRALCDGQSCRICVPEGSLYKDDDHLTPIGAMHVTSELRKVFEWPLGTSSQ